MKKIAFLLPLFALAACSKESPAPAPTATAPAAATPVKPSLPAPDKDSFGKLFAEACPKAEAVNNAVCKRAGMGSPEVICEYGLGEDKYLRDEATLVAGDAAWTLKDPEAMCEKHMDHHAG